MGAALAGQIGVHLQDAVHPAGVRIPLGALRL
jgi:hypothetical protein